MELQDLLPYISTLAIIIVVAAAAAISFSSLQTTSSTPSTFTIQNESVNAIKGSYVQLANTPSTSLVCGEVYDELDRLVVSSEYDCEAAQGVRYTG